MYVENLRVIKNSPKSTKSPNLPNSSKSPKSPKLKITEIQSLTLFLIQNDNDLLKRNRGSTEIIFWGKNPMYMRTCVDAGVGACVRACLHADMHLLRTCVDRACGCASFHSCAPVFMCARACLHTSHLCARKARAYVVRVHAGTRACVHACMRTSVHAHTFLCTHVACIMSK